MWTAGGSPAAHLLELPKEASFHDSSPHAEHPLDGVDLLIAGGMGEGLQARLARKGIEGVVTTETDPERAVLLWLAGSLPRAAPHSHAHGQDHDLEHAHEHDGRLWRLRLQLTVATFKFSR